jgi:hypothetical protein
MSGEDPAAAGRDPDSEPDRGEELELEPAVALEELLEELVDGLGLDAEIEVEETDGVLKGSLRGEDVGLFIGRRGADGSRRRRWPRAPTKGPRETRSAGPGAGRRRSSGRAGR